MAMDPARKAQIKAQSGAQTQDKAQVGALLFDEAPTEVPMEYSDYSDVFLAENAAELPENTCNIVATWPRYVISLVIIPNEIPLSPLIALTYCLVPDGSPFWYTKPHLSIVGNRLSYIALLGSAPAAIHPSSYCSFDSYSPTSSLLRLNFSSFGSVGIWITPQSLAIDESLQNKTSLGWRLRWEDVTPLRSVGVRL